MHLNVSYYVEGEDDALVITVPCNHLDDEGTASAADLDAVLETGHASAERYYGSGSFVVVVVTDPHGHELKRTAGTLTSSGKLMQDDLHRVINECLRSLIAYNLPRSANEAFTADYLGAISALRKLKTYL